MRRCLGVLLVASACQPATPPNILLVSLDTTRYDATSLPGGSPRHPTPNLAWLAEQGTVFTRAYAVANESVTSHASLFTGRYPSELAKMDPASFGLPTGTPTLASVLSQHGWATAAFTGGGHVVPEFGLDQGFQSFSTVDGPFTFGSFFDSVPSATQWIAKQDGPWFAFVHGYDAHTPYVKNGPFAHPWGTEGSTERIESLTQDDLALEQLYHNLWFRDRTPQDFVHASGRTLLSTDFYRTPPEAHSRERVELLSASERAHLRLHYEAGVHYADVWLGVLLSHVDLNNTWVIVVSDHGEDLTDHGWVNHRSGLWDSTLHVPLVIAGPHIPHHTQVDTLVDLRSIVPTILALAEIPAMAGASAQSLLSPSPTPFVFAEGTLDEVSVRAEDGRRLGAADVSLSQGAQTLPAAATYRWWNEPDATPHDGALPDLAAALADWRASLSPAQSAGTPITNELRDALQSHTYWIPEDGSTGNAAQSAPETPVDEAGRQSAITP